MPFELELKAALAAADLVEEYIRREYEAFVPIPNAAASICTHVDRETQELIGQHLRSTFPDDRMIGEEKTPLFEIAQPESERVWIIDPIDGTRGFAMKNGEFSVMIGFTVACRPVVGVVLEPVKFRRTYAVLGGGCFVQQGSETPRQCNVTGQTEVAASVLTQSRSKPGQPPKPVVTALQPANIVETYSAGVKLALVARGDVDLYVNDYSGFNDWDICAGHILVEEAGGRVSLFNGNPIEYGQPTRQRRGMVATNGILHDAVLQRLAKLH